MLAVVLLGAASGAGRQAEALRHLDTAVDRGLGAHCAEPTSAPVPPACSEAEALVNTMSTRDKLAQLLMVGVTGADDARAVRPTITSAAS